MEKAYIWKDALDHDSYHLGWKMKDKFIIFATLYCDNLSDIFGSNFYKEAKLLTPGVSESILVFATFDTQFTLPGE